MERTLRDDFAVHLAAGVFASATGLNTISKEERAELMLAASAFIWEMADAMMATREPKK